MTPNTRIYNKFTGYTLEDCACKYCLHYGGKAVGCRLVACCCAEERAAALAREPADRQAARLCRA